jgi:hypothetical protein
VSTQAQRAEDSTAPGRYAAAFRRQQGLCTAQCGTTQHGIAGRVHEQIHRAYHRHCPKSLLCWTPCSTVRQSMVQKDAGTLRSTAQHGATRHSKTHHGTTQLLTPPPNTHTWQEVVLQLHHGLCVVLWQVEPGSDRTHINDGQGHTSASSNKV